MYLKGIVICNVVFVVAPLQEPYTLAAELKLILKQDLDVPKFICYLPGNRLDDDQVRKLFQNTLENQQK